MSLQVAPLPVEAAPHETVALFGIIFHNVTFEDAVAWAVSRMRSGKPAVIATVNLDFVMQAWADRELHETLLDADLVLADGAPIVGLSKTFGPKLRERVTGSDLTPLLARECAREKFKIFLLGGAPGVADKAASVLLSQNPGLQIAGTHSPPVLPLSEMNHGEILKQLGASRPHLLLVAFGAPKQEKFIRKNLPFWHVPIAIGVGGTLDFLAGVQRRAPRLVQKAGLEWLWRLGTDPKRLLSRYCRNAVFLISSLSRLLLLQARSEYSRLKQPPKPRRKTSLCNEPNLQFLPLKDLIKLNTPRPQNRWALIDTGHHHWLDSRTLAALVQAARKFRKAGGEFSVLCPSVNLRRMFQVCHLDRFFHLFADLETAFQQIRNSTRGTHEWE